MTNFYILLGIDQQADLEKIKSPRIRLLGRAAPAEVVRHLGEADLAVAPYSAGAHAAHGFQQLAAGAAHGEHAGSTLLQQACGIRAMSIESHADDRHRRIGAPGRRIVHHHATRLLDHLDDLQGAVGHGTAGEEHPPCVPGDRFHPGSGPLADGFHEPLQHGRVPIGAGDRTLVELARVPVDERVLYVRHPVRDGDTLYGLARKYGVSVSAIQQTNKMGNRTMIRAGRELIIPTVAAATPTQNNASRN